MPGIGRDKTDKYSSSNKLFMAPLKDNSAHLVETFRSNVRLFIK